VSRTVVLHPGALGDVLLAVPALRGLRDDAPAAELTLAAQLRIASLLASLGVVDRDVAFDTVGLESLFADGPLSERARALLEGHRVVSWFGAGDATFSRRLRAVAPGAVLASSTPPDDTPVWRHLVASSAATPREGDAGCDPIAIPSALREEGRRALSAAGWDGTRRLVVIHCGAGGATKRWPPAAFAAVIERLVRAHAVDVVLHAGPADHDALAALRSALVVPARVLADAPLGTLAGALGHVTLWIGNDSGVTHLAAALGVPTLALFVPTNLRWRPWARHARVLLVGADASHEIDRVVDAAAGCLG
jgi:heptosyltransferase III